MYRERVNEKLPPEYLLHEFDELISCKSLGSYNCCEMVSIYLCQREKEMPDNVYTIFVFETRPNVEKSSERLLKKLKSITDTYSLGIQRKVLDVSEVRSIFELLCNSRDKKEVDIGDGRLETGYLEGVSKVFIQQDSTKEMLLNKVLKNNFINGSYILEFFDCDKKIVNVLNTVQFRKMTDTIFDAIPIDLFSVSDRIGNFVFQFPSTNVRVSYKKDDMERQLTYDVSFDKECESDDQFLVLSEGVFDDSIISFGTRTFKQEGCNTTFEVGDASRFCRTTIIDVKRQLILSRQETSFIRRMTYVLQMGAQYGEQRIIYDETGQVVDIIEPISAENVNIIEQPVIRTRDSHIHKRQYSRRVDELYARAEFRRYGRDSEPQKALKDVIALMNRAQTGKVYLWDPYLTVEDILHTWYFTKSMNVTLYAITSGEIAEKSKMSVCDWIEQQQEIMEKRSNHYGIHVELRCQWADYGYSFHDRFLMVLNLDQDTSSVWSLGTSVNSLGNKHHIIQSVEHPQMMIDAFEELWNELDAPECLVWKKGV